MRFPVRCRRTSGASVLRKLFRSSGWMTVVVTATAVAWAAETAADDRPDFESETASLLIRRCVECHRGSEPSGGLDLTTEDGLRAGGHSGAVVDTESSDQSELLRRVRAGEMPPEEQGTSRRLPESEIAVLERWLAAGAPWPKGRTLDLFERTTDVRAGRDWWSLQPVRRPTVPATQRPGETPRHPIDALIGAKLTAAGLQPAERADPRTLLRRLHFVLTGLPPTKAELDTFANDFSDETFEQTVDALLSSPQFGERWARHWLDVVRYADTSGYERDQEKPFAWKYRDWVVNAFRTDMPYDRFVVHQLAGDEIPDRTEDSVIATGFLRLGTWNDEPNDPADYVYDRLEDLVHVTSSAFLGMTVKCARCHTHKFDPILQEDYYRMASVFWAGPVQPRQRELLGGPSDDELGVAEVLGWTDVTSTPAPLHVLRNGERHQPMQVVTPATLSFLPALEQPLEPPPDDAATSRRRLQMARWVADSANPLTPRVMVNRLWLHAFGKGIVRTPNNFGFLSDPPTHPELLDWLAAEFVEHGWSNHHILRLILTSRTWQQSVEHPQQSDYRTIDAANRLWWHAERRRRDAEALRDGMLAVSGRLDPATGGPPFHPSIPAAALEGLSMKSAAWEESPPDERRRRSLYAFMKRGLLPPMMTTFDLADTTLPCGQRESTTVPTQALALLNNSFVHDQSRALAERARATDRSPSAIVVTLFEAVLGREPDEVEQEWALQHLQIQAERYARSDALATDEQDPAFHAAASLAHVLLNSNEFLYVD